MIPLPLAGSGVPPASLGDTGNGAPAPIEAGDPTILHGEAGGALVRRSVLPGGVRVLTEAMPGQRSATIGFWVGVGSRDEAPGQHGSTHFLEHLLFKGTKRRTAMEIASAFDEVGGESNAATAKESTCYFARVLDSDLGLAIDVIADMVTSAVLDPHELEQERDVILEEIAMDNDDPGDVAHEKFVAAVLGDHPLGRPIGGTPEAILAVPRESVWEHYQRYYKPGELVITAAGSLDHDVVCEQIMDALRTAGWDLTEGVEPEPRRSTAPAKIEGQHTIDVFRRPVEQTNIIMGCPGIVATDERRHQMSVLNAVLGGGMSSRLFQEIREKRGLVYSTYSFSAAYSDAGYFGMYAGCSPAKTKQVIDLLADELEKLAEHGITEEELRKAIGQLCGGTVLALEDPGSRMSRLGRAELVTGVFHDIDDTLGRVKAVTCGQVQELARELVSRPRTITVVGPFDSPADFGM
ncbi:putative Zn-dependent peptidase [Paeniglutamicibacter cryotolerans]|uniref:Putative Zn-dependent peptidase n=2 Tax=Paeniglutamicibacter cryotolerans TaxID=670079 RepID=A0A839QSD2_9MICC|nr:putative Zn-dependent peptidase [Paeniglutamicibacter cryotolerans]